MELELYLLLVNLGSFLLVSLFFSEVIVFMYHWHQVWIEVDFSSVDKIGSGKKEIL